MGISAHAVYFAVSKVEQKMEMKTEMKADMMVVSIDQSFCWKCLEQRMLKFILRETQK